MFVFIIVTNLHKKTILYTKTCKESFFFGKNYLLFLHIALFETVMLNSIFAL